MRYQPIGQDLFINNRAEFGKLLKPNSIAILNSNDVMPTNADGTFPFRQNNDLFYLSGIDQEESTLIIHKNSSGLLESKLFLRETSDLIVIWEGHKLTKQKAQEQSGISSIYWNAEIETQIKGLVSAVDHVYLNENKHARAACEVETRDDRFKKQFIKNFPEASIESLAPFMHQLRHVKGKQEIAQIQIACNITKKAFDRVLQFTKPGRMEYEIEAEITHEFIRSGSRGHAYQPIVASGANACVLHYIDNDNRCNDGDLMLLDFGAEYGNYNADLSRTIPVNGKFTNRQRDVYQAVLNVQKFAIDLLVPGTEFKEFNKEVGAFMSNELIDLGLLDKTNVKNQDPDKPLFRQYFMHGTSHSLGLDVHDVDDRERSFENGMVFTCEPGIYIAEEGIGVRIENDLVVNDNSPIDLMATIPREVQEIEELMNA